MKLNNKGWSLNTLLICIAILLSFLLLSAFYVYKFTVNWSKENNTPDYKYNNTTPNNTENNNTNITDDNNLSTNNNQENDSNKYYLEKESQLEAATIRYLRDNEITVDSEENTIIKINDLINKKYVKAIKDETTNNMCSGYSVVKLQNNDYVVKIFIKCDNYTTKGYGEVK